MEFNTLYKKWLFHFFSNIVVRIFYREDFLRKFVLIISVKLLKLSSFFHCFSQNCVYNILLVLQDVKFCVQ